MRWVRGTVAVLLAYVISQGLNGAFVYFWYFGDRTLETPLMFAVTAGFFGVVGAGSGYVAGRIAAPNGRLAGWLAAGFIVVVTVGNIVADVAAEPLWHKILVILVMAPLVGILASRAGPAMKAAKVA